MRIQLRFPNHQKYTTKIDGVLAGEDERPKDWEGAEIKFSYITLFGKFPIEGKVLTQYTLHFKTDIAFSLCKKLEKEGTADLATDYIRGLVIGEDVPGIL
jgi:hypothetical protein